MIEGASYFAGARDDSAAIKKNKKITNHIHHTLFGIFPPFFRIYKNTLKNTFLLFFLKFKAINDAPLRHPLAL